MSNKEAHTGLVVELQSGIDPLCIYLSVSGVFRYYPIYFDHYKMYHNVQVEI